MGLWCYTRIGMCNFLFDKSFERYVSANELYDWFQVSSSTGQARSKLVRDTLKMGQMDTNWMTKHRMDKSPLVWLVSVDGMVIDIRDAPRELQEVAFEQGIIPYLP